MGRLLDPDRREELPADSLHVLSYARFGIPVK